MHVTFHDPIISKQTNNGRTTQKCIDLERRFEDVLLLKMRVL